MRENILGKNLLILIAHPDDESFLVSGTLYENNKKGGHNYLLCASKGELGHAYMTPTPTVEELKKIREQELREVSGHVGIDVLKILNLPDGSIAHHAEKLEKEIQKFARRQKFDYVISFGEDGYTGHADHVAVCHVAQKLSRAYKVPLLQFAKLPKHICGDMDKRLLAKRKNGKYADTCSIEVIANFKIKINPFIKLKSLCIHKSQFTGLNPYKIFTPEIADHFLQNEYFFLSKPK
jgi:LmbE family N-acetylglucosaminyl deacetylase